jgi:cytochrome c oxidase assembly protein subunit 11
VGVSSKSGENRISNRLLAAACVAFFAGMVGMAYASVPLYQLFCQVTGYGGTTQRTTQYSDRILDRTITVRFDANTSSGLAWEFIPEQREVTVRIGETTQAGYVAKNIGRSRSAGRATFNVTPQAAGAYFNKVECFCFTDTSLDIDESQEMPVVFFVDPDIVDAPELQGISTITLSYTFFPIDAETPTAALAQPELTAEAETPNNSNFGG